VDDIGQGVEFNYVFNHSLIRTDTTFNTRNVLINQDPQFIDISREERNYRLKNTSPAIRFGDQQFATGILATDLDGVHRTSPPSAGAYEFVP
jgi:hypothetical protein